MAMQQASAGATQRRVIARHTHCKRSSNDPNDVQIPGWQVPGLGQTDTHNPTLRAAAA